FQLHVAYSLFETYSSSVYYFTVVKRLRMRRLLNISLLLVASLAEPQSRRNEDDINLVAPADSRSNGKNAPTAS
ncbi:hypothetical protein PENTCL1PPCAC_14091, partial [Pristionchus entomophagus]